MSRKRQSNVPGGRPVRLNLRLSDAEFSALKVAATELSVTVPRYLKESALAASRGETLTERKALLQHLFELQRQLAAVGNNLNQITRDFHTEGTVRTDLAMTLDAVRQSIAAVNDTLESLALDGEVA
jgi:hypothetical protein